ncbi:unnamed protein product [Pleuronectes platessa]|uniref:Uncharacterized protein n=1 Tax=Pleuronectes platessa TaxID=8262 RepID=A0A9N7THZ6_PLEPL|nr:unnamed protein product [Pleuronectes platessa]
MGAWRTGRCRGLDRLRTHPHYPLHEFGSESRGERKRDPEEHQRVGGGSPLPPVHGFNPALISGLLYFLVHFDFKWNSAGIFDSVQTRPEVTELEELQPPAERGGGAPAPARGLHPPCGLQPQALLTRRAVQRRAGCREEDGMRSVFQDDREAAKKKRGRKTPPHHSLNQGTCSWLHFKLRLESNLDMKKKLIPLS